MREIREYNMNGTIILGVDNGYGNVKTAHRVFPTGIIKCDIEPVLSKEYIEYDGAYYVIGEGHKGFVADKQEDDDTYILTLAAIAKELEARGLTEAKIYLAVGLPLKWVKTQREGFKRYLTRERYVSLKYKKVSYLVEIVDCTVMPQGYAAVAENLKDFKGMNLLVDIGNGTMNIMYLNNGRPIESKSWTEKLVQLPKKPEEPVLLSKYPIIMELDTELKRRNDEIFAVESERSNLEINLSECTGVFKWKQRKELQERIALLDRKAEKMKAKLSKVLRDAGYANAAEFYTELFMVREEKRKYEEACKEWQEECVQVEIEATKDIQYYGEVPTFGKGKGR